jgi:ACS family hexuronate transporter-like MFS transporter
MADAAAAEGAGLAAGGAGSARRWFLLGLLIAAGILNYVDRQVIAVLKPMIETDMGWTDADYGKLASLFQLAAATAYVGTGWIVDRLGVKWATPVGVAAWSLSAMAHGWAMTMGQFAAARIALGATESMGTPASVKTIGALFSARMRSVAFGISNGSANLGAVVTPLVLPVLAAAAGWRGSFMLVGAIGLAWTALWILVTRGVTFARGPAVRVTWPDTAAGLKTLLGDRRTWGVAGAKALSDQVWWLLLFWAPDFFHRVFHLSVAELGGPLALVYGLAALGSVAAGWIASRLLKRGLSINTVRKGMMLACAILVTPVPLALYLHSEWAAACLLGLTLAAHQGFSVSVFSTIADIIPKSRVGTVTSFGSLCGNLAGMGIVFLAGEILTAGLGYLPLLLIAAVSYLAALAWLQVWLPWLEPAEEPSASSISD